MLREMKLTFSGPQCPPQTTSVTIENRADFIALLQTLKETRERLNLLLTRELGEGKKGVEHNEH